jgi:large subunit ribosomal protein L23
MRKEANNPRLVPSLACIERFSLTSKSIHLNEQKNQIVLFVTDRATKPMARKALELMFGVRVRSIRVINSKDASKKTRWGLREGSASKKMIASIDGGMSVTKLLLESEK